MRCSRGVMKLSVAMLVFAMWPCASLLAQDYEIHLHHPMVVGQKYHLSATGRSIRTLVERAGEKILKNDTVKFDVDCECVVTVLAVDDQGKPSKLSLEIEKLNRTGDSGSKELASQGDIINVSMKEGNEIAEKNGRLLPRSAQEAIPVVLPLYPYEPTDDELFGTSERKKPGDHWDANTDLMAKDMPRLMGTARKEDIRGTVTLEKVVKVGDVECLQISGFMNCDKYFPLVPNDVTVEKGSLKIAFSEKLPVATSQPALERTQSSNFDYTVKGRPDPAADEVTMEVGGSLNCVSRATDVKEAAPAPK